MSSRAQAFDTILDRWYVAEERRIITAEVYREAHAMHSRACEKGTDAARKAYADSLTSKARLDRDYAEREAVYLNHKVLFYRDFRGE